MCWFTSWSTIGRLNYNMRATSHPDKLHEIGVSDTLEFGFHRMSNGKVCGSSQGGLNKENGESSETLLPHLIAPDPENGSSLSAATPNHHPTEFRLRDQLFSFFQASDNKLAMKLFGSRNALLKEKRRQQAAKSWIIHPCSNFRLVRLSQGGVFSLCRDSQSSTKTEAFVYFFKYSGTWSSY